MTHILRILALTAGAALCLLLPFLPGRYDPMAVPLSMMAQLLGVVGLVLVLPGAAWLAYEMRSETRRRRHVFAALALALTALVWALTSLAAMLESIALGAGALALGAYVVPRLWPRVRSMRQESSDRTTAAVALPLYLIIVPVALALLRVALADPAAELSRDRAIRNAAPLIADIERHRVANGRYPASIVSVHPDYHPGIIGIREYRYEPQGEGYNVLFEQLSLRLGIQEIVMYNPRGEQVIASHAVDVLQLSAEQLALDRTRGHSAVHRARQPNWKYFWFD